MACNTQSNTLTVQQAIRLRRQATDLLNRLAVDRDQSERRLAESGKRDPMKFVTGRTAFDAAIASARELIENMDRFLGGLNGSAEVHPDEGVPQIYTIRYESKSAMHNGKSSAINGHGVLADRRAMQVSVTIRP